MLGGNFQSYQDTQRYGVARVNTDGSLDPDFDLQNDEAPYVTSIVLTPNGRLMVSGLYSTLAGGDMSGLVRLQIPVPSFTLGMPSRFSGGYQFQFFGQPNTTYTAQRSSNLLDWITLTNFTCDNSPALLYDPATNGQPRQFYRGLLNSP